METVAGSDLLMTTEISSTEASSTSAGLGGSFDFQGHVSGSAATSEELATVTAAAPAITPMTTERFITLSLEGLLVCCRTFYHIEMTEPDEHRLPFSGPGKPSCRHGGRARQVLSRGARRLQ